MTDSVLISALVHGLAAGAMLVMALVVGFSRLGGHVRVAAVLTAIGVAVWLLSEQPALFSAVGDNWLLCAPNYPVGGLFWLFVLTIFADARVTPPTLGPLDGHGHPEYRARYAATAWCPFAAREKAKLALDRSL